ncbi:hypothetical protein WMO40_01955 [Bacillaceae bacterium CLA-AA-H227]|uniref:Uncharacterized protein n=1 Tax=Robertmurraya yapensis (ex Hitch et al 2024) TaxID=3133160 RepID=A0ACC6S5Z3_9BACI|nr:hypothetical protein [Bacillus yapensis]
MAVYEYNPEVKYLLIEHSDERVSVLYNHNPRPFSLPLIATRPPYFIHPRYEPYYTKI